MFSYEYREMLKNGFFIEYYKISCGCGGIYFTSAKHQRRKEAFEEEDVFELII